MKFSTNLFILVLLSLLRIPVIAQVQAYPVTAASFPKEVIPADGGKIEITAKFNDLSGAILFNEPFLFWFTDGISTYRMGFFGTVGMVAEVGDAFFVSTNADKDPEFEVLTYEELFPNFNINDWHVYTLQWDKNGIPGIDDGTRKVAIIVDGINRSKTWYEPSGSLSFPPLTSGHLNLLTQNGEGEIKPLISVKDLVIYDRQNNIILKNSLASVTDIESSIIGANGQFNGGGNATFPYFDAIQFTALTAHPIYAISSPSKPLVLTCESNIQKQHNKANHYYIPPLKTSGLFSNIDFSITGRTNRKGYGLDASGYFETGTSQVIWKATNKEGNIKYIQSQIQISEPIENDPGWVYYAPIGLGNYNGRLIRAGDINGDGFFELVAYYDDGWIINNTIPGNNEMYDRRFGTSRTFNGCSEGISPVPIRSILDGFFGTADYLPDFTLYSAGDVNGDGFGDLIGGRNFGHLSYVYNGSKNGIEKKASWKWDDYNSETNEDYLGYSILGKYAGDLNGDGYSDVVLTGEQAMMAVVFYGSSTGLKSTFDWSISLYELEAIEGIAVGDINNDGFDDLAIVYSNKRLDLFYGTSSGLGNLPLSVKKYPNGYQTQISAGGDINGDQFNDIVISGYSPRDSSSFILYGTATGLDTVGVKIKYLRNPSIVGDLNGDGFDDVVGNGLIYYGYAKGLYPIPDALVQHLTEQVGAAGDINHDGFDDILGRTIEEMQLYYGSDRSQLYKDRIDLCGTKDKLYSLPELYVNLPGSVVQYNITGTTQRSGSGTDPSGRFNNGTSYLTWKVTDQLNKEYSWTSTIVITPYVDVQIEDAYAVSPAGEANTIYLGYGKQYLNLRSKVTGGAGKYSYKWSTGSTAKSINVRPASAGTYWYVLWVTDDKNCRFADSVKVRVIDVRCDQEVTSSLNKYLPGWQSWMVLQRFLKETNFIKVCVQLNGKWISTCVPANKVASFMSKGAKLGVCHPNSQLIVQTETYRDPKADEIFSVKVSPNPSSVGFNLEVNGNINEPLQIIIRDPLGRMVERINCAYTSTLVIGSKLQKGMYFAEVSQGTHRRVLSIVKL